jgi:hypothetical protein
MTNNRPTGSGARAWTIVIAAMIIATLANLIFDNERHSAVSPEVQKAVDAKLNDTLWSDTAGMERIALDSMRESAAGKEYDSIVKGRVEQ